jgi:hypothetical protein
MKVLKMTELTPKPLSIFSVKMVIMPLLPTYPYLPTAIPRENTEPNLSSWIFI